MASGGDPQPPSLATAEWLLRSDTQAVLAALEKGGFAARIVGGAVRNALIGRPVVDVDIATTATPEETIACARAFGLSAVPTGLAHGTITVVAGHVPHEVTTLREDVETFGRHARVAFTADWAADARRRDLTINALYCDAAGQVHDPLGGYPDLVARRVRFIGDPRARIREDYLRILRFFRFYAEYADGAPDSQGLAACVAERAGLAQLSGERVRGELLRLLSAPRAVAAIEAMHGADILAQVLGGTPQLSAFARLVAIETAAGRPADAVLRLGLLAAEAAVDPAALRDRLKLSAREAERVAAAQQPIPGANATDTDAEAKAAIYRHGTPGFVDSLLLDWARSSDPADSPLRLARLALATTWQAPAIPVRGADILKLGVPPGPRVGRILAAFEKWWIASGFTDDQAACESRISELIDSN